MYELLWTSYTRTHRSFTCFRIAMVESREQAIDSMIKAADELGANAIVGVRFTTSFVMKSAAEFLVYGTAVKIK